MEKIVKNWLDSADYDLETAGHMFQTGRFIYTVFMCHLALEKALKAKVQEVTGTTPPKTHDLESLMGLSLLSPDEKTNTFMAEVGNLSVATRYPDNFQETVGVFSKKRTENILKQTKEAYQWIKKSLKP